MDKSQHVCTIVLAMIGTLLTLVLPTLLETIHQSWESAYLSSFGV